MATREILTCLDWSGSILTHGKTGEMINVYNDYIDSRQSKYDSGTATSLSFTYFSSYLYNNINLFSVPNLGYSHDYRGITALWDSMGLIMAGAVEYYNVDMAVFSDCFDNASHIYTHSNVLSTTSNRYNRGWRFKLFTSSGNTAWQNYSVFDYYEINYI